jgi:hypothetical protein
MGARPGDWSPLDLDHDPTPGDVESVRGVSQYMRSVNEQARTAGDGLQTILSQSNEAFKGRTADWLRNQVSADVTTFITAVRSAFDIAAPAVDSYAVKLEQAQREADQALSAATGMDKKDARRPGLINQAKAAGANLTAAARAARAAIKTATDYATNPWAKSACEEFWDIFKWIVLAITIVAVFVGGPLGLMAFGLNAALGVKGIVDYAQGKSNGLGLALSLLGFLFPSTRALNLRSLLASLATAGKNIFQAGASAIRGLGSDLWTVVNGITFSGIARGIVDLGVVMAGAFKVGSVLTVKSWDAAKALALRGFVTLNNVVVLPVVRASVQAGRGLWTHVLQPLPGFLSRELGGWKWLRIFTPLHGAEIGMLGLTKAFNLGVLTRGLLLPTRFGRDLTVLQRFNATAASSMRLSEGGLHVSGVDLNRGTPGLYLHDTAAFTGGTGGTVSWARSSPFPGLTMERTVTVQFEPLPGAGLNGTQLSGVHLTGAPLTSPHLPGTQHATIHLPGTQVSGTHRTPSWSTA